jgi:anti-sigma factor RsiW
VTARDHLAYQDEVGAYLLGALTDEERRDFEGHLAGCAECRDEIERLRPAADALPRSVEQVEPPPTLKASLMEIVESEAQPVPVPRRSRRRLGDLFGGLRPVLAAGVLAVGALAGFGVAQLTAGEETRSVVATVDESRIPDASARLQVQGDGKNGAILRVQDMPVLVGKRVYQAWVQRDGRITPQPTFEVSPDGSGAVAVPQDLSDAEAVLVTREARGGATAPSEMPVLAVNL